MDTVLVTVAPYKHKRYIKTEKKKKKIYRRKIYRSLESHIELKELKLKREIFKKNNKKNLFHLKQKCEFHGKSRKKLTATRHCRVKKKKTKTVSIERPKC
jgi:hypothetical protein